jgi:hypothetical protein
MIGKYRKVKITPILESEIRQIMAQRGITAQEAYREALVNWVEKWTDKRKARYYGLSKQP